MVIINVIGCISQGETKYKGMYHEDAWINIVTEVAIINILGDILIGSNNFYSINDLGLNNIKEFIFNVKYRSMEDVKIITTKETPTRHTSTLIDNQESVFVDLQAMAKRQQMTVNRLGNQEMSVSGRYPSVSLIPRLADTLGDYILAERTYTYSGKKFDFVGRLYKKLCC